MDDLKKNSFENVFILSVFCSNLHCFTAATRGVYTFCLLLLFYPAATFLNGGSEETKQKKNTTYLQKAEDAAVELTNNTGLFVCLFLPKYIQHGVLARNKRNRCLQAPRQPERTAGCQHIWKAVVVCCLRNLKVSEESCAAVLLFVDPIGPTCAQLWQITLKTGGVIAVFVIIFSLFLRQPRACSPASTSSLSSVLFYVVRKTGGQRSTPRGCEKGFYSLVLMTLQ